MTPIATASAPGKVILFGEHAVVYGRPALAVPVTQVRATVTIAPATRPGIFIEAPQVHLSARLDALSQHDPLAAAIYGFFSVLDSPPSLSEEGLEIRIASTIPVASGLGSGAAVTIALLRALSACFSHPLSDEQVNALAYEVEKLHHGTPSGIDNTVITYEQAVYFVRGRPMEMLRVGHPFLILIGDSGVRAPTRETVAEVRRGWEADGGKWESLFDQIGNIALAARRSIEGGEWQALGELMNRNHALLQEMHVSSPELDRLVEAARAAGALGAKLSGGGRGGNMIALVHPESTPQVARALEQAGARSVIQTRVE